MSSRNLKDISEKPDENREYGVVNLSELLNGLYSAYRAASKEFCGSELPPSEDLTQEQEKMWLAFSMDAIQILAPIFGKQIFSLTACTREEAEAYLVARIKPCGPQIN
jgi:hypothetical protein